MNGPKKGDQLDHPGIPPRDVVAELNAELNAATLEVAELESELRSARQRERRARTELARVALRR